MSRSFEGLGNVRWARTRTQGMLAAVVFMGGTAGCSSEPADAIVVSFTQDGGASNGDGATALADGSIALPDRRGESMEEAGKTDRFDAPISLSPDGYGVDARDGSALDVAAERVVVCARVDDPLRPSHIRELTNAVSITYLDLVETDCTVTNLLPSSRAAIVDWLNAIDVWTWGLWECPESTTPATFVLVHDQVTDLTSADAAHLIDIYLKASSRVVALTAKETAYLRQTLERFAASAVKWQSNDHIFSACRDGGTDAKPFDAARFDGPPAESGVADGAPGSATDAGPPIDATSEAANDAASEAANDAAANNEAANDAAIDAQPSNDGETF
ncbi:MAG TPA: hypothetical protein VJT73_20335 [Polyangiaceae bacterium]|nr:hypothetical protein [Polyangiaceae bacterium]